MLQSETGSLAGNKVRVYGAWNIPVEKKEQSNKFFW